MNPTEWALRNMPPPPDTPRDGDEERLSRIRDHFAFQPANCETTPRFLLRLLDSRDAALREARAEAQGFAENCDRLNSERRDLIAAVNAHAATERRLSEELAQLRAVAEAAREAAIEECATNLEAHAAANRRCLDGTGINNPAKLSAEDRQLHEWAADILGEQAERIRALAALPPPPAREEGEHPAECHCDACIYHEAAAAERAAIVRWICGDWIRLAGQNPNDAALFRLVAGYIERGEHGQPHDLTRWRGAFSAGPEPGEDWPEHDRQEPSDA